MGYRHHFYHTKPVSDADWVLCVEAFSRIVEAGLKAGLHLTANNDDYARMSNHEVLSRAWVQKIDGYGEVLYVNGAGDDGCEPIMFWKNANPPGLRRARWGDDGFKAIKTNRLPYDMLFTAFFSWLMSRFPDMIDQISSDDPADWEEGLTLARNLFPDLEIVHPLDVSLA